MDWIMKQAQMFSFGQVYTNNIKCRLRELDYADDTILLEQHLTGCKE